MARKSFFNEKNARQIVGMGPKPVYSPKGLVKRIMGLDPSEDSLELRLRITPGNFFRGGLTGAQASRKCYKHGKLIALSQPKTQKEAYGCRDIPLAIRARDFGRLETMREEDINFMGYSWYPVQGKDRRKRIVPFVWLPEALRLFSYAKSMTKGIEVKPYADSARAKREGADVLCNVPSRTRKKSRYNTIRLKHVPMDGVTERRAAIWGLKSEYTNGNSPEHSIYNIRYTFDSGNESSDVFTFYPQCITSYVGVIEDSCRKHNLTPFEMNPFALVSRREADFYNRLNNNVVIFDPTLSSKDKRRKLHLDEKCILIARSIGVLGHDNTMYWDPGRDGPFREYDWTAGTKK